MCGDDAALILDPSPGTEAQALMIHDEIRSLLDAPPNGEDAPTIDGIEHTLTAGHVTLVPRPMAARAQDRPGRPARRKSPDDEHSS
jgi:hypothetical protein